MGLSFLYVSIVVVLCYPMVVLCCPMVLLYVSYGCLMLPDVFIMFPFGLLTFFHSISRHPVGQTTGRDLRKTDLHFNLRPLTPVGSLDRWTLDPALGPWIAGPLDIWTIG